MSTLFVPAMRARVRAKAPHSGRLRAIVQRGPAGPNGPAGKNGGTYTTSLNQISPSQVWTLHHGLDRHPSVTLVDTAGDLFFAAVRYLDANTIQVLLDAPCAGTAHLN